MSSFAKPTQSNKIVFNEKFEKGFEQADTKIRVVSFTASPVSESIMLYLSGDETQAVYFNLHQAEFLRSQLWDAINETKAKIKQNDFRLMGQPTETI